MFKIILKNLWRRRKANGWLFAELVIITALMWFIIDPVVVVNYDLSLPLGYDSDRLVTVDFNSLREQSPKYDGAADSADVRQASVEAIYNRLRSIKGVESVTYLGEQLQINGGGISINVFNSGNKAVDSLARSTFIFDFIPGHSYFETYGIKSMEGSPAQEELSQVSDPNALIITRNVAEHYWPGEKAVGKRFIKRASEDMDTTWYTIAGVVENVRGYDQLHVSSTVFRSFPTNNTPNEFTMVLRVAEGESADKIADKISSELRSELKAGNYMLKSVTTYDQLRKNHWDSSSGSGRYNIMMLLAAFFFICLMLGVIGNFWLQTRQRFKEAGVLQAFGANRSNIMKMLLGESSVLTFFAFIIGDLIYLQIALAYGVSKGFVTIGYLHWDNIWVVRFWPHFFIISAIVLVIMEACVLLGTWLPARSLSRINPVDALRDE